MMQGVWKGVLLGASRDQAVVSLDRLAHLSSSSTLPAAPPPWTPFSGPFRMQKTGGSPHNGG